MKEEIFTGLKDLFFPQKCVLCRKLLKSRQRHICPECAKSAPENTRGLITDTGEFFSGCTAPYRYDGVVREAVHRYKFNNLQGYCEFFGEKVAEVVDRDLAGKFDIITWVPLSKAGRRKRGYDQAMLLAMATALNLNDVAAETLRKIKNTMAQSGMTGAAERRANVMGAYEVTDEELIRDKRVLVIDDVMTTGATLGECARTLLMAGAKEVWCAVFAYAGK